jgi:hypothetical protein
MSSYDPARLHRDQINLPPLNANTTPFVRWVHVRADGSEENYATQPANVPTIQVQIVKTRKRDNTFLEQTITAGPWPPVGRGWEQAGPDRWRWQRRRNGCGHNRSGYEKELSRISESLHTVEKASGPALGAGA